MNARDIIQFLRANPQVTVLVAICLVLALGTLVAVVIGLLGSGHGTGTGEGGAVTPLHALTAWLALL